jgi:hypothetical protein
MQKIMDFPSKMPNFKAFRISMGFDIVRYISIFLMIFGYNLGTVPHLFVFRVTSHVPDKGQVKVQYLGDLNSARREWASRGAEKLNSYPSGGPNAGDRPSQYPSALPLRESVATAL